MKPADVRTLLLVDGIRRWRNDCQNMSKDQALAQVERLFESALRLHTKWCIRSDGMSLPLLTLTTGLNRHLNEKQKVFLHLFQRSLIFGLRYAMLPFVPPSQADHVAAEVLDRAVAYVEQLKIVCDEGIWHFQQDIASAKLASFCATLQEVSQPPSQSCG